MTQLAPSPQALPPIILDVSSAQPPGSIDFPTAKAESNVVGVIVRVEAFSKVDPAFFKWAELVLNAGLPLGAYAFQYTDDDPKDEIKATVVALLPFKGKLGLGLWNDVETLNKHSPTQTVVWDLAYQAGTEDALGQPTGLYTGVGFWKALGVEGQRSEYGTRRSWFAQYGSPKLDVPPGFCPFGETYGPCLWQFSGNTIWLNPSTREQKWGKVAPGPQWKKIASANPVAGCHGMEVDCSRVAGDDLSRITLY